MDEYAKKCNDCGNYTPLLRNGSLIGEGSCDEMDFVCVSSLHYCNTPGKRLSPKQILERDRAIIAESVQFRNHLEACRKIVGTWEASLQNCLGSVA